MWAHYSKLATPAKDTSAYQNERRQWAADEVDKISEEEEDGPAALDAAIEEEELEAALRSTDNRKAPGQDQIPPECYKCGG